MFVYNGDDFVCRTHRFSIAPPRSYSLLSPGMIP
jgi:hypothetical protein